MVASACWMAPADAASSSGKSGKSSKSKKKASAGGGTGPSLTKNQEKVSECAMPLHPFKFTLGSMREEMVMGMLHLQEKRTRV